MPIDWELPPEWDEDPVEVEKHVQELLERLERQFDELKAKADELPKEMNGGDNNQGNGPKD